VVGRPHIAAILARKGYVSSSKRRSINILGQGGLASLTRSACRPRRAFELIRQSWWRGRAAHPIQLRTQNDAELDRVVKDLVDLGLMGIEVLHTTTTGAWFEKCMGLAKRYGLLTSGSDYHGSNKASIDLGLAAAGGSAGVFRRPDARSFKPSRRGALGAGRAIAMIFPTMPHRNEGPVTQC